MSLASIDENPDVGDERPQRITKNQSFRESSRAKIQLTFKNITIKAPVKKTRAEKKAQKNKVRDAEKNSNSSEESDEKTGGKQYKTILDNISGTVKPGEFLAILGASGAGKTTMLNYLSGKDISRNLKKSGSIQVNGQDRKDINFKKYIAYV